MAQAQYDKLVSEARAAIEEAQNHTHAARVRVALIEQNFGLSPDPTLYGVGIEVPDALKDASEALDEAHLLTGMTEEDQAAVAGDTDVSELAGVDSEETEPDEVITTLEKLLEEAEVEATG